MFKYTRLTYNKTRSQLLFLQNNISKSRKSRTVSDDEMDDDYENKKKKERKNTVEEEWNCSEL